MGGAISHEVCEGLVVKQDHPKDPVHPLGLAIKLLVARRAHVDRVTHELTPSLSDTAHVIQRPSLSRTKDDYGQSCDLKTC